MQYGITLFAMREVGEEIRFHIPLLRCKQTEEIFLQEKLDFSVGDLCGILGLLWRSVKRPAMVIGVSLGIALYVLLTGLVWEVRVVAPEETDEDRVVSLMAECGLYEGVWGSGVDIDRVATSYLLLDDATAFVTIHMRGMVAEVELLPKIGKEEPPMEEPPCHVVATQDAVIRDVRVYKGDPVVQIGEVVRKGDLLVSGVVTSVSGTRLLHAEAEIWGEVTETITVTIPLEEVGYTMVDIPVVGWKLSVFSHTIAWGEEGRLQEGRRWYLLDAIRLPVTFTLYRQGVETSGIVTREAREAAELAQVAMRQQVLDTIGEGNLIRRETEGHFAENAYVLTCHLVYEKNIAESLFFDVTTFSPIADEGILATQNRKEQVIPAIV